MAKMMYRHDFSYNDLVNDFMTHYYGEAEKEMKTYYEFYRAYLQYLQEEKAFGGALTVNAQAKDFWPLEVLQHLVSMLDDAIAAIEPLKQTDPVRYQTLKDRILKEKVVPYAAAAISALGLLYAMVSPILKKLSNSSKNFDASAEATKKTTYIAETVTTICGSLQRDNAEKYKSMELAIAQTMNTMQERESDMMAEVQKMVAQAVKQVKDAEERMREQYDQINDEIRLIYEREGNIMQIGKIGFGEQTELIKKGVADSIMKIGGEADNERAQA
jgi:hypothetical protein